MLSREEKNKKQEEKLGLEQKKEKNKKRILNCMKFFIILFVLILSLFCYMRYVSTTGLIIKEYRVVDSALPSHFHGLKIIHFSDMHYNSTFYKEDLEKMIKEINQLKPDIVIFTGDLTDQDTKITNQDITILTEQLNKINATLGVYAIRGNHDYSTNTFDIVFTNTKFKILDNNYDLIYSNGTTPLLILGFGSKLQNDLNIEQALTLKEEQQLFTLGVFHEPDIIDDILPNHTINLALAGHSHNGQIRLPKIGSIMTIEGSKKYPNEYYQINSTKLYISGGLGTSVVKLRFFNRPSINFYRVVEK